MSTQTPLHVGVAHLSDIHIGQNSARITRFRALLQDICANFRPGEVVIAVTGDLTEGTLNPFRQKRHLREMDAAREALLDVVGEGYGVVVVPGNHDLAPRGATFTTAWHRRHFYKRVLRPVMDVANPWRPVVDVAGMRIIGVNSMAGQTGPDIDLARGRIGREDLVWLEMALIDAHKAGVVPVVVMHHNVDYDAATNVLEDAGALLEVIERAGGCRLLLQGHEHRERWIDGRGGIDTTFACWRSTDPYNGPLAEQKGELGYVVFYPTLPGPIPHAVYHDVTLPRP